MKRGKQKTNSFTDTDVQQHIDTEAKLGDQTGGARGKQDEKQSQPQPTREAPSEKQEEKKQKKSQADIVVDILLDEATDVFVSPDGTPFVRLPKEDHHEIIGLNSNDIRSWLSWKLYDSMGKVASPSAIGASLNVLRGKALSEEIELHNRVAQTKDGDGFWYDLSNEKWQAVRVDKNGWRVVDEPPILFRRYQHQKPQVEPKAEGNFFRILDFVNVDEDKQLLFMVYVLSCFLPDIPHPVALYTGPKGSAKTTAASIVRRVVDPSQIETFSYPDKAEAMQILSHNWMATFDNISSVPAWLSDTLCRACTGAGDSKRQLYSDDDDVIYSFRRCVSLTSISSVADMPDLLDRSVTFELQRISPQERLSEQELLAELEMEMPGILGGAFDVLVEAIRIRPHIELEELPRMADFALWGAAIAVALGYTQEQFIESYEADIRDRNLDVVETHPVGAAIQALMEDKVEWEGTATELLSELNQVALVNGIDTEQEDWPKTSVWLARRMNEVSTDLQQIGITITHNREPNKRTTKIISEVTEQNGEQLTAELDDVTFDSLRLIDDEELLDDLEVEIDLEDIAF
jgi:hypothetical protein